MTAATSDRIVTLDVIRGIAVMGIFSVNVIAFAMIEAAYFNPPAMGGHTGVNLATWFANFVIIDGKMRSLFSMLFGASALLVIDRAIAAGRSPARTHYARMLVLAAIGLFHFYFIWWGDILFQYAFAGAIVFFFRKLTVEKLIAWSAIFFGLSLAIMILVTSHIRSLEAVAHAPNAPAATVAEWNRSTNFSVPATSRDSRNRHRRRPPATPSTATSGRGKAAPSPKAPASTAAMAIRPAQATST